MPSFATDHSRGSGSRHVRSLADQLAKGYCEFRDAETWAPAVNLYETDHAYQVCVDLAGVHKEEIDVEVADNLLRLRGVRSTPSAHSRPTAAVTSKVRVHLLEIDHGSFSRTVELPDNVDRDRIAASYLDGLLWIDLPKLTVR